VPFDFPQGDLDLLAEMEHDRWMKMRIADEWRWGEPRDNARKLHPALILWRALDEEEKSRRFTEVELAAIGPGEIHESEKQKDRDLVRGIPAILARNGFAVVKTRADDPGKR
jgi:hypothetical protein